MPALRYSINGFSFVAIPVEFTMRLKQLLVALLLPLCGVSCDRSSDLPNRNTAEGTEQQLDKEGRMTDLPGVKHVPRAASIKQMSATLDRSYFTPRRIDEFLVPTKYFDEICSLLSAGEVDNEPLKWMVFGHIKMTTKAGDRLSYSLFQTGQLVTDTGEEHDGLAYRRSPKEYYRGGDATVLARLLIAAASEAD
jgi:hypothetical protein